MCQIFKAYHNTEKVNKSEILACTHKPITLEDRTVQEMT